jgi:outer membrane lipoprotein SlyB
MQMIRRAMSIVAVSVLALGGCAVAPPTGPSVAVMPGKDKSFEAFQADDGTCKQYASQQIGGVAPAQAASESVAGSAVVGTVLGAAAGAAIGAATGNPAAGAAIGAGSGAVLGTATGLGMAQDSSYSLQQRYDLGYMQCMSAKGNSVPQGAPYPQTAYVYPAYPYAYPYPSYYPGWYGPGFIGFGFGFHDHDHFHHHH